MLKYTPCLFVYYSMVSFIVMDVPALCQGLRLDQNLYIFTYTLTCIDDFCIIRGLFILYYYQFYIQFN